MGFGLWWCLVFWFGVIFVGIVVCLWFVELRFLFVFWDV